MKLNKIRLLLSIIIVILFSTLSVGQDNLTPLPEGVSIYLLDNGIEVMLIEKPSLPMVGVNTVVKVGSAYENFATSGMSHMLEHLLFNGTTTMTQKELYDSTDIIGGYNNANTAEYYTNFMMVTPAENIVEGIKLQSAMLFDSVIPEDKFEKEKGIVLEEIAKSLGKSSEQIDRNILSVIYEGHALSLPTLGTYTTIENMNRDAVYNFYKNYYVPNNMIISVIGNFNSSEMLQNIKDIYGKVKPGVVNYPINSKFKSGFENFTHSNYNNAIHRFYNGENTQLQLFFEISQPENFEFFELVHLVLDNKKDSIKAELNKLYPDQIEGLEFTTRQFPVKNYLQTTLILKDDKNIKPIRSQLQDILFNINFTIPKETIETESIKARTRFLQNTEKPHMFGIYNAGLFAEYGIEQILTSYSGKGFISASKDLKDFSLQKDYITIVQHPQEKSNEQAEPEESMVKVFESKEGKATIIAKQSKGSDLLAIHYLLKNKALYETEFGKDAAKIWHDAFGKRMENPEIQKISAKYGFTFTVNDNPFIPMDNVYLSPEFGYIRAEGLADNISAAVDFLNGQMLSFVPTREEFEHASGKSKMPSMMGHGNMANKIFESKLESVLYEEEKFSPEKELTYESLIEFGKVYFTPSNMIISVVSPALPVEIDKYFDEFKGEISAPNNELGFIKKFKGISEPIKVDIEGGGEQSYLYYGFQKTIDENDKAALKVLSLLLSDHIIFDIREKQGLAYRMSAGIDIIEDKAMFYINMGTRPENVETIIPQFPEFFTKDFTNNITESSVKRSVNMYLGRMMFRRLSSINQAYYLGHSKYFYNDVNHDSKILDAIKTVTAQDVIKVINKYLEIKDPVEVYVK